MYLTVLFQPSQHKGTSVLRSSSLSGTGEFMFCTIWSWGTAQQHALLHIFSDRSLCLHRWYTSRPRTRTLCSSYCSAVASAFLAHSTGSSSISHQTLTNSKSLGYALSGHGPRRHQRKPVEDKKHFTHSDFCVSGVAGCCYTDFLLLWAGIRFTDRSWQLQYLQ